MTDDKKFLRALQRAIGKIPKTIPYLARVDLVCTLYCWKLLSDRWCAGIEQPSNAEAQAEEITHGSEARALVFNDRCLFKWRDWSPARPVGETVRAMLIDWHRAQTAPLRLDLIFRPERFGRSGPYFVALHAQPVLSSVLHIIGNIGVVEADSPCVIGRIFDHVLSQCMPDDGMLGAELASLMAMLAAPQPGEQVLDPACHCGNLLAACADVMVKNESATAPWIIGNEENPALWALAKMRFLLRGEASPFILSGGTSDWGSMEADVVVCDARYPASHWWLAADVPVAIDLPFCPATNGHVAMAYDALARMKAQSGRTVLLLPNSALPTWPGGDLCHYLVEKNWLDAVLHLFPGMNPAQATCASEGQHHWIFVVKQNRTNSMVAYIGKMAACYLGPQPVSEYNLHTAADAWTAYLSGRSHPHFLLVDASVIAQRLPAYSAWYEPKMPALDSDGQ